MRTSLVILSVFLAGLLVEAAPSCSGGSTDEKPNEPKVANGGRVYRERVAKAAARARARWNSLSDEQKQVAASQAQDFAAKHQDGDRVNPNGDSIGEINARAGIDQELYDGDMIVTEDQLDTLLPDEDDTDSSSRKKRQGYKTAAYPGNLWLDTKPIPYDIHSSLGALAISTIHKALQFWEGNTCISFSEGAAGTNRLLFYQGTGCWSYIGKVGGTQNVSIGAGCESVAVVTHEVGHALGFLHSQSRIDRDSYVSINMGNVQAGKENNFEISTADQNYNYEQPYDYGSVMQYSPYSFAINSSIPTVVSLLPRYQNTMGQTLPSFYDVLMMNKHYQCFEENCPGSTLYCHQNGVVDVKNCSRCRCNDGFTGDQCSKQANPNSCGQLVKVTTTAKSIVVRAGNNVSEEQEDYHECHFQFIAPVGKKIKFTAIGLGGVCTIGGGCSYGGVEIKWKLDRREAGYRYCCGGDLDGQSITTETQIAIVRAYNRYAYNQVTLQYVAVDS